MYWLNARVRGDERTCFLRPPAGADSSACVKNAGGSDGREASITARRHSPPDGGDDLVRVTLTRTVRNRWEQAADGFGSGPIRTWHGNGTPAIRLSDYLLASPTTVVNGRVATDLQTAPAS